MVDVGLVDPPRPPERNFESKDKGLGSSKTKSLIYHPGSLEIFSQDLLRPHPCSQDPLYSSTSQIEYENTLQFKIKLERMGDNRSDVFTLTNRREKGLALLTI